LRRSAVQSVFLRGSAPAPTAPSLQLLQSEKAAFVGELRRRCGHEGAAHNSPVNWDIQLAVSHLRSIAFRPGERWLFVVSDLQEDVEPNIRMALMKPTATKVYLPPEIDNAAVDIT
jgi:hypothetical protein